MITGQPNNLHGRSVDGEAPLISPRFWDSVRQLCFPAEFRIAAPEVSISRVDLRASRPLAEPGASAGESTNPQRMIAEIATLVWYMKTKHFKRDWEDHSTDDEDPRVRRSLGRLNKGIDTLKQAGIEVHDPTNTRYPPGGEGMMRPVQFLPTAGVTLEQVTETMAPIIYRNNQLIQRGEVFVAVPTDEAACAPESTRTAGAAEEQRAESSSESAQASDVESQAQTPPTGAKGEADAGVEAPGRGDSHQYDVTAAKDESGESESAESATSVTLPDSAATIGPGGDSGEDSSKGRRTEDDG